MEELTERQNALYNLLQSDMNHWFTQKEICDAIPEFHYRETSADTHDHCSAIGLEKRKINAIPSAKKVIVMKNCCFKIGTFEEYMEERASHIARLKNEVAQIKNVDAKFENNVNEKKFDDILDELAGKEKKVESCFAPIPKEINGVRVYTRVFINWSMKIAYVVSFQKYASIYMINSTKVSINFLMADGSNKTIDNLQEKSWNYQDFIETKDYKDFKLEFVR